MNKRGSIVWDARNEGKPAMQSVWPLLDGARLEKEGFMQVQRVCRRFALSLCN